MRRFLIRGRSPDHHTGGRLELDGVSVRLKIDGRARRVSLRLDPVRREMVATAPSSARLAEAARFARERRAWAVAQLARFTPAEPLAIGGRLVLFGEPYEIRLDGRRARIIKTPNPGELGVLAGCGDGQIDPGLVTRAVRLVAQARFSAIVESGRRTLGVERPSLTLSDTKSRWGSCTPAAPGRCARLRLSWRLALAPLDVATYVAAHECAHLIEANHGARFWFLVGELFGDSRLQRAWLRAHGARLHAFAPR